MNLFSSIVHSEEELAGSYNWDYLLDWGPQYQPLAHVFQVKYRQNHLQSNKNLNKILPGNFQSKGRGRVWGWGGGKGTSDHNLQVNIFTTTTVHHHHHNHHHQNHHQI